MMKKLNLFYDGTESLQDDVIFGFVANELPPVVALLVDIHLENSPRDLERIEEYRQWQKQCLNFRDEIKRRTTDSQSANDVIASGFNVVHYDFRAEAHEQRLVGDDSLTSEAVQPFDGVREKHFKEVKISGVPLRVTMTRYDDESIWMKIEALTSTPLHRWFRIGIGSYRGSIYLDGFDVPFYEAELPATLFSSFANVLIQLQPSNHE